MLFALSAFPGISFAVVLHMTFAADVLPSAALMGVSVQEDHNPAT